MATAKLGTKWGVIVSSNDRIFGEGVAVYDFDSAWSPISAALHHFGPQWPKLNFRLQFVGEGEQYYGETEYAEGKLIRDFAREPVAVNDILDFFGITREQLPAFLQKRNGMSMEEAEEHLAGFKDDCDNEKKAVVVMSLDSWKEDQFLDDVLEDVVDHPGSSYHFYGTDQVVLVGSTVPLTQDEVQHAVDEDQDETIRAALDRGESLEQTLEYFCPRAVQCWKAKAARGEVKPQ